MGSVLDDATAHFDGLENGDITVPEWNNRKLVWKPLTCDERRKIYAPLDNGQPPDGVTVFIRTLIAKALTEDGKNAFTKMDENKLAHGVDPTVVSRIAREILGFGADLPNDQAVDEAGNA
ncbi:hypothetical protein [Hoeflea sp. TYP-13]|uniref:hypothetical protein n=1 Tax=Hoeflea sp. TYP-13 TaxID=3230023 RepID=UPI0034C61765